MGNSSPAAPLYTNAGISQSTGAALRIIGRASFFLTIVSLPMRYRVLIVSRPTPPVYRDYTDILLFLPDIFLLTTLAAWLFSLALTRKQIEFRPVAFTLTISSLVLVVLVSTILSTDRTLSLYYLLRTIGLFGLYLYAINEIHHLKTLAIPIACLIFIQSLVGIGQAWQQSSLGLSYLGELHLDPALHGVSIVGTQDARTLRAYGLTDHPNLLGGSLALSLLLFAGWMVRSDGKMAAGAGRQTLIPASALFGLGCLTLYFSYSRSAWLALSAGVPFAAFLMYTKLKGDEFRNLLLVLSAATIILLPFVLQNLTFLGVRLNVDRSFDEVFYEKQSLSERKSLSEAGNQIFATNAVHGVGPGVFPLALRDHAPEFPYDYQPPHFVLLEAAAETGIFGGLLLMAILIFPWGAIWVNRRRIRFSPGLIFTSAAVLGITIISLFDYYPWLLPAGRYWLWLLWGVWGGIYTRSLGETAGD